MIADNVPLLAAAAAPADPATEQIAPIEEVPAPERNEALERCPVDVLLLIFRRLDPYSLARVGGVCRRYRAECSPLISRVSHLVTPYNYSLHC